MLQESITPVGWQETGAHGRPFSECLSDANEILGRGDSWNWIEIAPQVEANGPYRRAIPQSEADVVAVEGSKVVKSDAWKHIAAIIKQNDTQSLLDGQRDTGFGIDQQ